MTTPLHDESAERKAMHLVAEEGRILGAKHAKRVLDDLDLVPDDFASGEVRSLFGAIVEVVNSGLAPIAEVLRPRIEATYPGAKWEPFAAMLRSEEIHSSAEAKAVGTRLRGLSMRRKVVEAANRLRSAAVEPEIEPHELLGRFAQEAKALPSREQRWHMTADALDAVQLEMADVAEGKHLPAIATGIGAIDAATAGLPATLCVIAAMPGVGKSSLWASIVRNLAKRGDSSATFSMEDSSEWLAYRFLAHEARLSQFELRYHRLSGIQFDSMIQADSRIRGWKGIAWLDDRPALRASEVIESARYAYDTLGAKVVAVDNLTAMRFQRGPRMDLEIQDFLTDARALANEFKRPFVVLSHVKRRDGLQQKDMPRLTDCSETSAFEKLCRVAIALARDPESTTLKIEILKNTNGKPGTKIELPMRMSSSLLEDKS